jgi:hypothetical protein
MTPIAWDCGDFEGHYEASRPHETIHHNMAMVCKNLESVFADEDRIVFTPLPPRWAGLDVARRLEFAQN